MENEVNVSARVTGVGMTGTEEMGAWSGIAGSGTEGTEGTAGSGVGTCPRNGGRMDEAEVMVHVW